MSAPPGKHHGRGNPPQAGKLRVRKIGDRLNRVKLAPLGFSRTGQCGTGFDGEGGRR